MAKKNQTQANVQEQVQVITSANTQEISDMLVKLNNEHKEWVKSTTQLKQHKQDIKEILNISDKVYLSILKAYKDNQIIKAKEDRDADKAYLKEFEHTAKIVLKDMQQDTKYSTYLRDILKQYKDNFVDFIKVWSKEWDGVQFLTQQTFYNIIEGVIVTKYAPDYKLNYNKVYTLVSKCIDNLSNARKAGIKDKEFNLSKYSNSYIVGVFKFGELSDNRRPKRGEKIEKPTDKMLSNLLSWDEYKNSL